MNHRESNTNYETQVDLQGLYYFIKSRLWIVLVSAIIAATTFGLVGKLAITKIYTSTSKLYILGESTTVTSLSDLQIGTEITQDTMLLAKSQSVVSQVIRNLKLDMSNGEMLGIITIKNPNDTRILEVTANYQDPYMAKEIVNEYAKITAEQIAKIMDTVEPAIVEEGHMQTYPSSPNVKRNIIIGGLIGILFAVGIMILLYILDDTIKTSDDVENYLNLNVLGMIPKESAVAKPYRHKRKYHSRHWIIKEYNNRLRGEHIGEN